LVLLLAVILILAFAASSQARADEAPDAERPQDQVAWENTPPVASFTIHPPAGYVGTSFSVDGSGSSDAEDESRYLTARYDWTDDGYYDTNWLNAGVARDHTYDTPGTKTIRMIVKDRDGATGTTTRTLQVDDPGDNTPPTARCTITPTTGTVDTMFTVSASTSSDAQDDISAMEARWDWWGSGHWPLEWVPADQEHQRQWTRLGIFVVRLMVRDSGLLSDDTTCSLEITTGQPNQPPTASFTISPTMGYVTTDFTFDASSSTDPEDALNALQVRYDWEDDGVYDTIWRQASVLVQHRYDHPGGYTVRMLIEDSGRLTDETTRTVQVDFDPDAEIIFLPSILRWH
jgi:PKD repeat protein